MTREEHLKFCTICENQKFDPNRGVICGLTDEIANFEDQCPDFKEEAVELSPAGHDYAGQSAGESSAPSEKLLDNTKRASLAINVFWGICVINFLAAISGYMELGLLEKIRDGAYVTEEQASMNDLRQTVVALIQAGIYLASMITFLNWFRRAYGNLHRMNFNLDHNESMAVWSFFIPIISLYRPYQIAKEIATSTRRKLSELSLDSSSLDNLSVIGVWWAFFLITNYIGQFAFKSILKEETLEQVITSNQIYLMSDLADIPAALVTLLMIKKIAEGEAKIFSKYEVDWRMNNELIE